ncbi:hypothetical protein ACFLZ2_02080 [Candidatus Margulisiibacteriota bacterium]
MNYKKLLFAGAAIWLFNLVYSVITDQLLFHWVYEIQPKIWKDPAVLSSPRTIIGTIIFSLFISVVFAAIYVLISDGIPGKGLSKGAFYGLIIWILGPLAGHVMLAFTSIIPQAVLGHWIVSNLISTVLSGVIVSAVYKQ